jgi:pimeloyl-ACP methyl ester carboxylesterase
MTRPHVEYIEVDGINLRVATQRGEPGIPLLLFNGIGANLELCFPFMEAMPEKEIVIFDVPGVGRSEMSWRPRRFSGLARLANKLLSRLGYREVDVIGVSWGGALAQQFARQYPQRCRRLILAATSPGAVMVPGKPSVLARLPLHAVTCRRTTCKKPPRKFTAVKLGEIRKCCRRTPRGSLRPSSWDTSINSWQASAGPASTGCIASGSRRWSWPGPKIRWCQP